MGWLLGVAIISALIVVAWRLLETIMRFLGRS
jgi:hypothetical protein